MARYRKIDPRIWNDEKFREQSDSGKLAFLFLLTHPHMTALGAMRATIAGLAEELGWSAEAFREAFGEALRKGMAEHDPRACLIALPNFLKYNVPESPNVVKAWVSALDLLPECSLKTRTIARAKGFAEALPEAFAKALPEAFAKSMPYQEQEQEQEQEQKKDTRVAKAPRFDPKAIPLPESIPEQKWAEWIDYRRQRGLTIAEATMTRQVALLDDLAKKGNKPADIIDASITNGWQGLFEPKEGQQQQRKSIHDQRAEAMAELTGRNRRSHEAAIEGDFHVV